MLPELLLPQPPPTTGMSATLAMEAHRRRSSYMGEGRTAFSAWSPGRMLTLSQQSLDATCHRVAPSPRPSPHVPVPSHFRTRPRLSDRTRPRSLPHGTTVVVVVGVVVAVVVAVVVVVVVGVVVGVAVEVAVAGRGRVSSAHDPVPQISLMMSVSVEHVVLIAPASARSVAHAVCTGVKYMLHAPAFTVLKPLSASVGFMCTTRRRTPGTG